jgi:hypothetical protein
MNTRTKKTIRLRDLFDSRIEDRRPREKLVQAPGGPRGINITVKSTLHLPPGMLGLDEFCDPDKQKVVCFNEFLLTAFVNDDRSRGAVVLADKEGVVETIHYLAIDHAIDPEVAS